MKIRYHQGKDGQWYAALVASNGKVMLSSEGYASKSNAKRAAIRLSHLLADHPPMEVVAP
jgi:uncharacterized protein YegP (UPF0339 family)